MNPKLFKLGFYVLTYILAFVGIALLIDYRLSTEADFNFFDLNESYKPLFWLIIISYIFGLTAIFLILRDWFIRKRLPFYIGMIALSLFLILGLMCFFI